MAFLEVLIKYPSETSFLIQEEKNPITCVKVLISPLSYLELTE
jgi:hypothetical protein